MGKTESSGATKWIILATAFLGLLSGAVVLATKYFEYEKARTDALRAQGDSRPQPADTRPTAEGATVRETRSSSPTNSGFQPRSTSKDVLAVGHGKIEVTAQAVAENRVVISVVGRDFGDDYSPLNAWLANSGDVFKRKLEQLGVGTGTWGLVGDPKTFTIRDGMAFLEVTFQRP